MSDADLTSRVLSGRYELERVAGRGGMATVYLARDLRQARRVAVKVLDPDLARTISGDRFLREITVAAKLAHPHILPLHDSGDDQGLLYYVMPYVEGETLGARLDREGPLPLEEALRLTCEVASALEYAHGQGVIHRDIKPANILLEQGHAVLADFGIARALDAGDERFTVTGISLGTPAYMSPEQSVGESRLDARSDIYSLACVLYEMLAGEPPFSGATAQSLIAKRLGSAPPRVRMVRPSAPEQLERALLRAMERTPADRFTNARDFARALEACAHGDARAATRIGARAAIAAGLAMMIALVVLASRAFDVEPPAPAVGPLVAVLPLANESADAEHAYLAEGLTNAVIEDLTRRRDFRVVSRASVMRYAAGAGMSGDGMGSTTPAMAGGMSFMDADGGGAMGAAPSTSLRDMAQALRADLLLQGSVSRTQDSLRVNATLVRAPELTQVWQKSFVRHARDLFALQRDVVDAVALGVDAAGGGRTVGPAGAARAYAAGAHESYLKGAYYQAHWKLPQAVAEFERAVAADPSHAPAQAGLARAYYFLSFFGELPPSVAVAGMRRAAQAALASDSTLADAHAQMALVRMLQDWDWDGADRDFRNALTLGPGHAQIRHDYAHFLLGQGRWKESAEQTRLALALDPVNPMLISCLGWHSLFDGRYADAKRHAVEANLMMPDHWAFVVKGWALLGEGKRDSAVASLREARRVREIPFTLAALAHGLAVAGHVGEARTTLAALLARAEREYVSPYDVAAVYAGLGARDDAIRWLRRAADERSAFIVHVGWDARFDALRTDPRLTELTQRQLQLPAALLAAQTAEARRGM